MINKLLLLSFLSLGIGVTAALSQNAGNEKLSGGQFAIQKSVIAGGGAVSNDQQFGRNTTIGQALAGHTLTSSPYAVYSGFWTADNNVISTGMGMLSPKRSVIDQPLRTQRCSASL